MAKTIKTLFFSPSSHSFFFSESNIAHGGAEFQMFLLAKALSGNKAFEVDFFVSDEGQKDIEYYKNIKLIKSINLPPNESFLNKIAKSFKLFFLLKKHKPDVIITTTANVIVGIISLYSKLLKFKHIHRTAHQKDVDGTWINKNGIKGRLYKKSLENASAIFVQSNEYQNILKHKHNLDSYVVKNGYLIKEANSTNKDNILWVSRFQKWKKPELFIDLASKIPDCNFVMICPYNKKDEAEWLKLKQKAEKLGNITFIKKVPFNKIQKHFNEAKLFVNTSDFEGFPNTFLQAAQGQTPIVSLNVNPDEFLNGYNCGVFCNNSFDTMLTETKKLIQNQKELKTKGKNAFKYLKENHNIEIISKQLETIVLNAIK